MLQIPPINNLYYEKHQDYFSAIRKDWIDSLPINRGANLLEIGCGTGDTGLYALQQEKCGKAYGVEIFENAAQTAKNKLTDVITGNIESIELRYELHSFDVLIMSEVLEHLVDPWEVLKKLRPFMKSGALVFASSPNISCYKIILMILAGKWGYESEGVMDKSHLRWFTPNSYREMFNNCGYQVDMVGPVCPFSLKKKIVSLMGGGKLDHLLYKQIDLRGRCS